MAINGETAQDNLTKILHSFSVPDYLMAQVTPMETQLTESLLTPGLQTTVKCHSYFDNIPIKNLDLYKGSTCTIDIERPVNGLYGAGTNLKVKQTVYRIGMFKKEGRPGTRKLMNDRIEEFVIHACDPTILTDAETLVSKDWKCTPPSAIVAEMLACVRARATNVEGSCCPRDWSAQNIHPFQVINLQANAALIGGSPSFLHYMTYENLGTHKFRSLDTLVTQSPVGTFEYGQTGTASTQYANPYAIMSYNFPCDFDLLTDLLNGIGPTGGDLSSIITINPFIKGIAGSIPLLSCGKSTILKMILSNQGSAGEQLSCPDYAPLYALKRQARMSLLEQDKLALNMIIPWNPDINAGKVIRLILRNKVDGSLLNYGSGDYLIHTVTHTIRYGGYAITMLDCVSTTVGQGVV